VVEQLYTLPATKEVNAYFKGPHNCAFKPWIVAVPTAIPHLELMQSAIEQ
jgi:hypothetical protein